MLLKVVGPAPSGAENRRRAAERARRAGVDVPAWARSGQAHAPHQRSTAGAIARSGTSSASNARPPDDDDGVAEGIERGLELGKAEGLEQGKAEGLEQGKVEGLRQALKSLMKTGMSEEQARQMLNL